MTPEQLETEIEELYQLLNSTPRGQKWEVLQEIQEMENYLGELIKQQR